jgi:prepilin-type N-terminal cleavage/methylation domain-containing protein
MSILKKFDLKAGFSLIEVLMALTLFSFFIGAFMMSQGFNITSSSQMAEDLRLNQLAERIIKEKQLDLPKFSNATDNQVETKQFEEDFLSDYRYTVTFKKMKFPDLASLLPENPQGQDNQAAQKMVFEKLKQNIELMMWQLEVKVENTQKKMSYQMSTWVLNPDAQVDLNLGM